MSEKSLESESYSERRESIKLRERAHETREPLELDAEPSSSSPTTTPRFSDPPLEKWKHFILGKRKNTQWKKC